MILEHYYPNEYLLLLIFSYPNKFKYFIENYCKKSFLLTDSQWLALIKYIHKSKWKFENSLLKSFISEKFYNLPKYMINNLSSSKYRSVKTLNGYPFDIAKSGIQKYTRRAYFKKSSYMMADIFLMKWATEGSTGSLTNFYNRIRITFLEDIGLGSPYLIYLVNDTLKDINDQKLSNKLPFLFKSMAYTIKSRFYSHVRAYYKTNKPENPPKPKNKYILDKDEKLRDIVDNFIWCMENKDVSIYYWFHKIMDNEKLLTKRFKSTRPGFLIFDILYKFNFITDMKSINICFDWYKIMKMREQFLSVLHPVYLYVLKDSAIWTKPNPFPDNYDGFYKYYNRNLLNKEIVLDNYVLDMHTQQGRTKLKRTNADFALEGSLVSYDLELYPNFAEVYFKSHLSRGEPSYESKEFKLKSRAQLNTSGNKPDVYFATNILNQNIVVKGPFLNKETLLISFKLQNIMKLFNGVNTYNINVMVLYPDMFPETPLGIRNKVKPNTPYYFIVMEDIMDQKYYPKKEKSSKLWHKEQIVDYEKLFKDNKNLGFGIPSTMNSKALFSLVIQLAFRLAFKIGDNAYRNFLRIGDMVYNLDTEGIMVGDKIQWSKEEIDIIKKCCRENFIEYNRILKSWLNPGDSFVNKWVIVEKSLTKQYTNEIKERIEYLSETILGMETLE